MKKYLLTVAILSSMLVTSAFASTPEASSMNLTMLPSRTVTATAFCIFKNDCRVEDKEILHAAKESAIIAIANDFQSEDAVLAEAINLYRQADSENSQLTDEEIISIIALQD